MLVDDVDSVDGDGSSHSFERLRADRRIQIAFATVLLLVVLLIGSLLLLL